MGSSRSFVSGGERIVLKRQVGTVVETVNEVSIKGISDLSESVRAVSQVKGMYVSSIAEIRTGLGVFKEMKGVPGYVLESSAANAKAEVEALAARMPFTSLTLKQGEKYFLGLSPKLGSVERIVKGSKAEWVWNAPIGVTERDLQSVGTRLANQPSLKNQAITINHGNTVSAYNSFDDLLKGNKTTASATAKELENQTTDAFVVNGITKGYKEVKLTKGWQDYGLLPAKENNIAGQETIVQYLDKGGQLKEVSGVVIEQYEVGYKILKPDGAIETLNANFGHKFLAVVSKNNGLKAKDLWIWGFAKEGKGAADFTGPVIAQIPTSVKGASDLMNPTMVQVSGIMSVTKNQAGDRILQITQGNGLVHEINMELVKKEKISLINLKLTKLEGNPAEADKIVKTFKSDAKSPVKLLEYVEPKPIDVAKVAETASVTELLAKPIAKMENPKFAANSTIGLEIAAQKMTMEEAQNIYTNLSKKLVEGLRLGVKRHFGRDLTYAETVKAIESARKTVSESLLTTPAEKFDLKTMQAMVNDTPEALSKKGLFYFFARSPSSPDIAEAVLAKDVFH